MSTTEDTLNLQTSEAMIKDASSFSPFGVPNCKWWAPDTFYIRRASGSRIFDVDGNEYLDFWCGAGPHILGHAPAEIIDGVMEAINEGNVQFAMPNFRDVEVARKLSEFIPCAEKVALCVSGTDGILYAVRLARAYTGKTKIVKFDGGYQGWADPVAVNNSPDSYDTGQTKYATDSAGIPPDAYGNTIILPYNDIETAATALKHQHDEIAAVLVETMIHSSNLIARPDFLEGLRRICDELGIVLIFDEIVTGFRHGLGGGQAIYGVTPDLGVFGKAMASGYVIAAIVGKNKIMSLAAPEGTVRIAGTFGGNALGTAAALSTLKVLARPGFYEYLYKLGDIVRDGINEAIRERGLKARCDGFGSVWCMYFSEVQPQNQQDVVKYRQSGGAAMDQAYRAYMQRKGIFIRQQLVNRAYISAAHTEEDMHRTVEATAAFLDAHGKDLK